MDARGQAPVPEDGDGIVLDYDMAIAEAFNPPSERDRPRSTCGRSIAQLGHSPLLIVRGEASDLLSAETAAAMVDAIPGAELVTVPGVGHPPELTEPAATAAIDSFLAQFDSGLAGVDRRSQLGDRASPSNRS